MPFILDIAEIVFYAIFVCIIIITRLQSTTIIDESAKGLRNNQNQFFLLPGHQQFIDTDGFNVNG